MEDSTRARKYHQAALAYLVYGLIYLSGAVYLSVTGASERAMGGVFGWFLFGGVFLLVVPPLIWRGFKWFTRVIALLLLIRAVGLLRVIVNDSGRMVSLPWGGEMPQVYGAVLFLFVALATCALLVRAAWSKPPAVVGG